MIWISINLFNRKKRTINSSTVHKNLKRAFNAIKEEFRKEAPTIAETKWEDLPALADSIDPEVEPYRMFVIFLPTESPPGEIHYYVNGLYHLLQGDSKDWHVYALRAAWNGEPIEDRRAWHNVDSGEYLVLTDEEADRRAEESCLSYMNEVLEIPENIQPYFDEDKWLEDALQDGRGHILSSYDGQENEHYYEGEAYYIYRIN